MMQNILKMQIKAEPGDFELLEPDYFYDDEVVTEEIGFWKASWIRLKENKIVVHLIEGLR